MSYEASCCAAPVDGQWTLGMRMLQLAICIQSPIGCMSMSVARTIIRGHSESGIYGLGHHSFFVSLQLATFSFASLAFFVWCGHETIVNFEIVTWSWRLGLFSFSCQFSIRFFFLIPFTTTGNWPHAAKTSKARLYCYRLEYLFEEDSSMSGFGTWRLRGYINVGFSYEFLINQNYVSFPRSTSIDSRDLSVNKCDQNSRQMACPEPFSNIKHWIVRSDVSCNPSLAKNGSFEKHHKIWWTDRAVHWGECAAQKTRY